MEATRTAHYQPRVHGDPEQIARLVEMMETAERPVFYTGGGVINSGPEASRTAARTGRGDGLPDHLHPDGTGGLSGERQGLARDAGDARALRGQPRHAWLRPDDQRRRALRRPDHGPGQGFLARTRRKAHIDIDPSSINKVIRVEVPIIGDVGDVLAEVLALWKARGRKVNREGLAKWWRQIAEWRAVNCLTFTQLGQDDQAAIRAAAARGTDQGHGPLHHDRGRPAPDVGRAVPRLRGARTAG